MRVMSVIDFLDTVDGLNPGQMIIYFSGAFAFHKSVHEKTPMGYRIEALSQLALRLEEEGQILLTLLRRDDFLYDYIAIKRKNPPTIPDYLIENVEAAQDAFNSDNWLQGLGKIYSRPDTPRTRIH